MTLGRLVRGDRTMPLSPFPASEKSISPAQRTAVCQEDIHSGFPPGGLQRYWLFELDRASVTAVDRVAEGKAPSATRSFAVGTVKFEEARCLASQGSVSNMMRMRDDARALHGLETQPTSQSVAVAADVERPPAGPDQRPAWELPALTAVLAVAGAVFGWGASRTTMETFYAAAARSMSVSWRGFVYGALDPAGSITIDKLWGFLWPQALSARVFGFHAWSLALPVAIEGVVTVLVLYRAVRRWSGPAAAVLAAAIFTLTPVVAAGYGRSGLEDTALTMCLVLAAAAWQRAVAEGRLRPLLMSGFWVGMAFQTKMVQAWAVLPVLLVVYLCCAPGSWALRLRQTCAAAAVALAVSLSLMLVVQLTPAADRPYLDGSSDDNVFRMVFGYNFVDRFGSQGPQINGQVTGWGKLLAPLSGFSSQIGWLYPLAALAAAVGLVTRRGRPRTDTVRAGYLMWGGSLVLTGLMFSAVAVAHSHYTLALAPDIAALSGAGLVLFARLLRERHWLGWSMVAAAAGTLAWTGYLSSNYSGFLPWLTPVVLVLGIAGAAALGYFRLRGRVAPRLAAGGIAAVVVALLGTPAAWALSSVDSAYDGSGLSAAAGPYGQVTPAAEAAQLAPAGPMLVSHGALTPLGALVAQGTLERFASDGTLSSADTAVLAYLQAHRDGAQYLAAVSPSPAADAFIVASGASILPMGGFGDGQQFPTPARFQQLIASGRLRYVLAPPFFGPPFGPPGLPWLMPWVSSHCSPVPVPGFTGNPGGGSLLLCGAAAH
jgi:4-amino-4-deoxy-L-arabinose transferase-like glycosyltransferase